MVAAITGRVPRYTSSLAGCPNPGVLPTSTVKVEHPSDGRERAAVHRTHRGKSALVVSDQGSVQSPPHALAAPGGERARGQQRRGGGGEDLLAARAALALQDLALQCLGGLEDELRGVVHHILAARAGQRDAVGDANAQYVIRHWDRRLS